MLRPSVYSLIWIVCRLIDGLSPGLRKYKLCNFNTICNHFQILFQIVMIHNTVNGKPRGYAFVEYEHERDMHCEYSGSDIIIFCEWGEHFFIFA